MELIENDGEFYNLCQELESWIIEYNSFSFDFPLYMVWFTDSTDNDTDKFILDKNDKIFASTNPSQLIKNIGDVKLQLLDLEKTEGWLSRSLEMEIQPFCSCEITLIKQGIVEREITDEWLSEITNFINLYRDYGSQLQNENILALSNKKEIELVWECYYDNSIWPHFKSKTKFNKQKISNFKSDFEKLSIEICELIQSFEMNIKIR